MDDEERGGRGQRKAALLLLALGLLLTAGSFMLAFWHPTGTYGDESVSCGSPLIPTAGAPRDNGFAHYECVAQRHVLSVEAVGVLMVGIIVLLMAVAVARESRSLSRSGPLIAVRLTLGVLLVALSLGLGLRQQSGREGAEGLYCGSAFFPGDPGGYRGGYGFDACENRGEQVRWLALGMFIAGIGSTGLALREMTKSRDSRGKPLGTVSTSS